MLADAPHPNAAYAWLNFIHEPEIQARGDELQPVRDAQRRGQGIRRPQDPRRHRRSSRPTTSSRTSRAAKDTSGNTQRNDIYAEFKQAVGG